MRVHYLGLEAFVLSADYGSFRRAAESLNLSQTALSHRLKKVEDDLGVRLLIRSSREVSLTPAGQHLLPRVRRLLKELHETYESARIRGRQPLERLAFACVPSIAYSLLPGALRDFTRTRPEVAVHLQDVPVNVIADRVTSGEAEFGVTIVSAHLADLRVQPLFEEEYVLLVPAAHDFAARGEVGRADLVGWPMARITTQSKNRQLVDTALGEYRDRIDWRYEVQNGIAAMSLVAAGMAFTILPRLATAMAPANLVPLAFTDVRLRRTLGIVQRRGVPLSAPAADLLSHIEDHIAQAGEGNVLTALRPDPSRSD